MTDDTVVQLGILVVTVFGPWVGARLLVDSGARLARRAGLSDLVVGLTVVAVGTSTPELVVTVDAALAGAGDIAVANVVGSNRYDLAFILGVVSLLKVVPVERPLVHRDGFALAATTLAGFAAMGDLTVGRFEGLAFVASFVAYTGYLGRTESERPTDTEGSPSNVRRPQATADARRASGTRRRWSAASRSCS